MAKKSNNKSGGSEDPPQSSKPALNGTPVSMDPSLAALFSSSVSLVLQLQMKSGLQS